MSQFKLVSEYEPKGDLPEAIRQLVERLEKGDKYQTLLGEQEQGRHSQWPIIIQIKKPTLIMAHNKTLAAQLYSEFKEFFPEML